MSRRKLSPVDIAGITLGVIAMLVVAGSIVGIARQMPFRHEWKGAEMGDFWEGKGGDAATRAEKEDRFPADISEVEIRNVAGSIDVHGGSADALVVHSVRTAMMPGALENVRVSFQRNGSRLVVEEKHIGGFFRSAGTVAFDVAVPRGVNVIEVHSVSGSVTVEDVQPGIAQKISTISGSISTSKAGNLDVSSTSGSITFVFSGRDLEARTISGSIEGKIDSLDKDGTLRMHSVSGSVDMDVFSALDASVSLHSLSGGVSCDFPLSVTDQKRTSLEGRIGNGSARVEVTTTSGPITIRKM